MAVIFNVASQMPKKKNSKRRIGNVKTIEYKITTIEEPITKSELRVLKKFLGEFTLKTNAGVDLHSSEVKNGKWNGITIKRL
jgi:hypothetical protein